jgi:hypothetical protein
MNDQQTYSHGLLYSVAPEDFSTLHLNDGDGKDVFDWNSYEAGSLGPGACDVLKTTAIKWGLIKASN